MFKLHYNAGAFKIFNIIENKNEKLIIGVYTRFSVEERALARYTQRHAIDHGDLILEQTEV